MNVNSKFKIRRPGLTPPFLPLYAQGTGSNMSILGIDERLLGTSLSNFEFPGGTDKTDEVKSMKSKLSGFGLGGFRPFTNSTSDCI